MTGSICGTGSCLPERILTNDEIAEMVETSDAWIRERTGIRSRHIVTKETVVSMATKAAKKALQDASVKAEEVGLILAATVSAEAVMPGVACEVQKDLGAFSAFAFDLNAACTGFVAAYHTARAYIETGFCDTALIIGSEALSGLVDWKDRSTCILFGDGAGAAVLKRTEKRSYRGILHSDGSKGFALRCSMRKKDEPGMDDGKIRMDGQEVFKFAVKRVPEVIQEVLTENNLRGEDISYYLLHQANRRIIEAAARRLGEPAEKFLMNLETTGNTSSASIPILLDEKRRDGTLRPGQKIVMAGFGAGLSWGAQVLELN